MGAEFEPKSSPVFTTSAFSCEELYGPDGSRELLSILIPGVQQFKDD